MKLSVEECHDLLIGADASGKYEECALHNKTDRAKCILTLQKINVEVILGQALHSGLALHYTMTGIFDSYNYGVYSQLPTQISNIEYEIPS